MKYYVDCTALQNGNGQKETPFKLISCAAQIAKPGDEVLVMPGIYREYVDPVSGGTEDAPIIYRSVEPLGAVITGAEVIDTWEKCENGLYMTRIANSIFGDFNPYKVIIGGDWYFAEPNKHAGCVYADGKALYEAVTLEECLKGEKTKFSWEPESSIYKWYTTQDEEKDETIIYVNLHGIDPQNVCMEINVRRNCFLPSKTGRNYITVSGFTITKAATTWAPPAAYQDGMIGPHWSKGWIIENCDISYSKCAGISVGKYYDPENEHYFTHKHVKSPTQMERDAVCRGQYHGWLKENIGSHIIRHNNIHHCEQGGIIGRMGGVFSIIEDNHIHHINNMMELGGAEIAGIKMHAAIDVIIRRNHIHHATMGIWCDWQAQGTRITQNLMHDNQRPAGIPKQDGGMESQDIFVEVSHGPTLIDNNILLSDACLRFATQGVAFVHNLTCGAFTSIGENTTWRYTPYHIPHRTEVMGFMTILHGDDRFYNNIFIQKYPTDKVDNDNREAGTHVFDAYPTYEEWYEIFDQDLTSAEQIFAMLDAHFKPLPIWSEGNVYINGAKMFREEINGTLLDGISLEGIDETLGVAGTDVMSTPLMKAVKNLRSRMINTEVLGKAFEPEQAYENPDGTPIQFDTDIFGNHRGVNVIPGPFAI